MSPFPAGFPRHVAVIGLGYIGLPTAMILAGHGLTVTGVDVNERTVESVRSGQLPFVEPGLTEVLAEALACGRLTASTAVPDADVFIIAVPTPFLPDRSADLTYVRAAAESIAPRLSRGTLVVLESTSPPGTTAAIAEQLAALRPDLTFPQDDPVGADVCLAHCPERVLPGHMLHELVHNDRVVGGMSRRCAEAAAEVYRVFSLGSIQITDAASAELCKLVENSFRDVNIAFANELSVICDRLGMNVWEVIELANHHPRVNILTPGPGVGGHCIAVDPWFIVGAAPEEARLIRMAREVNDSKPSHVAARIAARALEFERPTIACMGLAFKADIDDLRGSPAIDIVEEVAVRCPDSVILVAEPYTRELPGRLAALGNVALVPTDVAVERADVVALLVDHREFVALDLTAMEHKAVIDTRGVWRQQTPQLSPAHRETADDLVSATG